MSDSLTIDEKPRFQIPASLRGNRPALVALIGSGALLVSVFLPWRAPYGTPVTGFETGVFGQLALIGAAVSLLVVLARRPLILGALAVLVILLVLVPFAVVESLNTCDPSRICIPEAPRFHLMYGWGLAIIGSVVIAVGGLWWAYDLRRAARARSSPGRPLPGQ